MDYARQILREILTEEARIPDVTNAIKKRYEAEIYYKSDDEPKGKGRRIIQPVAYGKTKSGNLVVRAFQPFGDSETRVPHWKLFRLDRIEKWKTLRLRKFEEPPSQQWGAEGKFNPNGDKSMDEVYLVANFNGAKNNALKKYNDKRNAERVAKDPLYNLKRNIKKSIMATPEIMDRIKWSEEQKKKWQKKHPNYSSASEMASITDFGDSSYEQTSEPVKKNDQLPQNTNYSTNNLNYSNIENNGPVYKQQTGDENKEENGNR